MTALDEVKQAVQRLEQEGEDEHEGPKIDLSRILMRVIRNYERRGIDWCMEEYW